MTDILAPVANKLAPLVRMLSSDNEGEVVNAARAIVRILKSTGADIHALADRIGSDGGLTEAEMKKLYDAGYSAGVRATENKQHGPGDFHNIDGTPDWAEMAVWCQQHSDRLREREAEFVDQMAAQTVWREPTERQGKWLLSIFYKLGGKRP